MTTKPSMGNRDVLYKSGVYARKALCLPVGRQVLPREVSHVHRLWVVLRGEQSTLTAWEPPSPFRLWRAKEVSPAFCGMDGGHTRRNETDRRGSLHGRTRNPPCISKEQVAETLGLNGKSLRLCRL